MAPPRSFRAGGGIHGRFFVRHIGIVVATLQGMATWIASASSPPAVDELRRGGMVCWLFYRDNRAMSCDLSVAIDGESTVHVTRLWDDESFAEVFTRPEDALQRHAEISSFLHESGWLLAQRTTVPLAA
jgi:hypothetical protein